MNQIVDQVEQWPERSKLMILAPLIRERRGAHKELLEKIGRDGFVRVRIDGELFDVSETPELSPQKTIPSTP